MEPSGQLRQLWGWTLGTARGGRALVSVVRLGLQAWEVSRSRTGSPACAPAVVTELWGRYRRCTRDLARAVGAGVGAGFPCGFFLPTALAPPNMTVGLGPQANFAIASVPPMRSHPLPRALKGRANL